MGSAPPAADLLRRCCSYGGLERLRTHARRGGRRSRGRPHFWMVCGARALPKLRRRAPNWPLESSRPSVCARRRRPAHARPGARVSHGSVHMLVPGSVCWRANYGVPGRGTSPRVLRASWRVLGIGFGGVVLDSVGDASAFLIRPLQSSDARVPTFDLVCSLRLARTCFPTFRLGRGHPTSRKLARRCPRARAPRPSSRQHVDCPPSEPPSAASCAPRTPRRSASSEETNPPPS